MKLQTKIQLFSSVFMLIIILLINTAIYFLFYNISADSELDELSIQTDMIVEALNESPDLAEEELLKAFLPNEGMIRVIGKDSKPIIPILTKKKEYSRLDSVFSTSETRTINTDVAKEHVAVISKPIIWNNGDVVTLQVSNHLIALHENMRTLFYVLLVASIVMLIPLLIGANVLSRFLLKPIKALTKAMKQNTTQAGWNKITDLNKSKDELYEMEATFNEMIDHLEENFQKQEVFVSDASHELKTPISIIKSYAQLLSRRGRDHPELFNESVEAIESESDRMQKLVEQMLDLAKNQASNTMEEVDFTAVCLDAVKTFRGARNREIYFQAGNMPIIVRGNKDHLEQVVYVLIDNALKYSEQAIEVQLKESEQWMSFSVTDYGNGIPQGEQDRIFDRFYRMDKARSRETGGTGLGLPIAQAITKAHHGHLEVTSEVGKGSTFTLKLPQVKNN